MHSNYSDGADTPVQAVEKAVANGLTLMALTDHDTMAGVPEAVAAGRERGIPVLPALEMDTNWTSEVHILGIDVDPSNPALNEALTIAKERRDRRNAVICEKLRTAGYDIAPYVVQSAGNVTRLHLAMALVKGGFAKDVGDAFARFLKRGCVGYYTVERFSPEEVIHLIREAGGVPVWAHPFHAKGNLSELLLRFADAGLMGVEAFHPSASPGQSRALVGMARQNNLLVTCGSDSHGAHRPEATIGCTWKDTPELDATWRYFMERIESR